MDSHFSRARDIWNSAGIFGLAIFLVIFALLLDMTLYSISVRNKILARMGSSNE